MSLGETLTVAPEEEIAPVRGAYISARARGAWLIALALVLLALSAAAFHAIGGPDSALLGFDQAPAASTGKEVLPFDPEKLSVSDPVALQALTPEEALAANLARPASVQPNPAARPLIALKNGSESYNRSLDCLTAAIYYESAYEPVDGQRAVAQVVLNRVRHPGYPASVCSVVFQGSERSTGCQFSFTCDGSLGRTPNPALWERVRKVAAEALGGYVFAPVGLSTHYHADYVVPYWASSLVKLKPIGRHIFYRISGSYGSPQAFAQLYASHEPHLFDRNAAGRLVILNDQGLPVAASSEPALVPAARPILDNSGRVLAEVTAAGKPSDAAAKPALGAAGAPPPPHAASLRWIFGMDGGGSPVKAGQAPGADASWR